MSHSLSYKRLSRLLRKARQQHLVANHQTLPSISTPSCSRITKNHQLLQKIHQYQARQTLYDQTHPKKVQIAIIGAGLGGLNTAYQLSKSGIQAHIFESSTRIGGRIHTVKNQLGPNLITDVGAELVNSDHDDILSLIDELDLSVTPRSITNNMTVSSQRNKIGFFYNKQQFSESQIAAALLPFARQLITDSKSLDQNREQQTLLFDSLPLNKYLDQYNHLLPTKPNIRHLIESTIRVEYGVEPEASPTLQLLQLLPTVNGEQVDVLSNSDEAYVISGGSESIIQRLKSLLYPHIYTNQALTRLSRLYPGYELTFNNHKKIQAQYVVLALPLTALRKVSIQLNLPESLRQFINEIGLGKNEKVIAGINKRIWLPTSTFENEAWSDQSSSLIWDSSLRQSQLPQGTLTFYFGANEIDRQFNKSVPSQGQDLLHEFESILPGLSKYSNGQFLRTSWRKTPGIMGGYTNFKPGQYTRIAKKWLYRESYDPNQSQDFVHERLVFAGEHTSDAYYGFMNGAAQSGRLAANWIVQHRNQNGLTESNVLANTTPA